MPRKQNGWGNSKSLAFKGNGRVDRGKGKGAPGTYPSNRRYGTSVHRTIIEKYNLDSDWVKWRKGYEYYNQAVWYRLQDLDEFSGEYKDAQIQSKLYQGTPYEVDVVFDGYKFATKNADSNNHYVMKRTTTSYVDLGTVTAVYNDALKYPEKKANREIWVQGNAGVDSPLLTRMIGERLTDGETEATLDYVLTAEERPAVFIGKSFQDPTVVKTTCLSSDMFGDFGSLQNLVGKIVYIEDFFVEKPVKDVKSLETIDGPYFFGNRIEDIYKNKSFKILDPTGQPGPPSIYDISTLDVLATVTTGNHQISGTYVYDKSLYQKFYGDQYLTGQLVMDTIETVSYTFMPYTIIGIGDDGSGNITIESVPFTAELRLSANAGNGVLIFTDYSFTKTSIDEYDGDYYHQLGAPGSGLWTRIDTDVDPWMDEVFTSGNSLRPATIYTCSCPNHSHSILRAPQATEDENTRKVNRQRRYPMPTVLGKNDFDALGLNQAAGVIESWESREHRMDFKMCKHSIAAMFIDKIKVKEPNTYPTMDAREDFEEKLAAEIAEVAEEFRVSYKRGGITALEVVFALAQGLNLDDVETAYVVLNSNF